jgi:hypothetical protein
MIHPMGDRCRQRKFRERGVKMKKIVSAMSVVGLLAGVAMTLKAAPTVDHSGVTSANAVITSATSLTVTPKNIADDAVATEVGFTASNGMSNMVGNQYLEVAYASNENNWGVNIWTDYDNATPPVSENLGGLHKDFTDNDALVPLGWQAFNSVTDRNSAPVEQTGAPESFADADWTFIKSKKDSNWATQQNDYARILVGTEANSALLSSGPGAGAAVSSPVFVYVSGYFGSKENVAAGSYAATLGLDLYHE